MTTTSLCSTGQFRKCVIKELEIQNEEIAIKKYGKDGTSSGQVLGDILGKVFKSKKKGKKKDK